MTTAAKTTSQDGSHWYTKTGEPCYEVPYADPRKGMRPTTLRDARTMNLLPSVTTVLRVLHKQALVDWLIEQACLAVLTTPKLADEQLDAFVERVLHTEKVQDQESQAARDRGTEIHAALESMFAGVPERIEGPEFLSLLPWIEPAYKTVAQRGKTIGTETIVTGDGFAGKVDLVQEDNEIWLWDWKTTKKLPDPAKGGAWLEHRLQLAGYAKAWAGNGEKRIRTGNVYISTVEQGKFCVCEHGDWQETYEQGFKPLVQLWQFINGYKP